MVPYMVPYIYEMLRKSKLFNKAKNSPYNFKFKELCTLAENVGFIFRNQTGSHKIYKHKLFNLDYSRVEVAADARHRV